MALLFALSISHKFGSKIFAVHVIAPPPMGNYQTIEAHALAAQALRGTREASREFGGRLGAIPHETEVRRGEIWNELSTITKEKNIDLTVHGIRPVSTLAGTGTHLGTVTAHKVVSRAPCPVSSVRGETRKFSEALRQPSVPVTRIS